MIIKYQVLALAPLQVAVGSVPCLYFILTCPFATAGHYPSPCRGMEDALTSAACGVAGGPFRKTRFGLGGGRSRCSLPSLQPPVLSESSESYRLVRAFMSGHPRPVGPIATSRPRRGGVPDVVSESHPSGESGDTGRPGRLPGGSLPCCCRRGAGAGLRCHPEPACPSITGERVGGIKSSKQQTQLHAIERTKISKNSRLGDVRSRLYLRLL